MTAKKTSKANTSFTESIDMTNPSIVSAVEDSGYVISKLGDGVVVRPVDSLDNRRWYFNTRSEAWDHVEYLQRCDFQRSSVSAISAVMEYDQLMESKARHNAGTEARVLRKLDAVDDIIQEQSRAIRAALAMLDMGDRAGARRVLESVKV